MGERQVFQHGRARVLQIDADPGLPESRIADFGADGPLHVQRQGRIAQHHALDNGVPIGLQPHGAIEAADVEIAQLEVGRLDVDADRREIRRARPLQHGGVRAVGIALHDHVGRGIAAARPDDPDVDVGEVRAGIDVDHVAAFQVVLVQDLLQRSLGRRGRQPVESGGPRLETKDVVVDVVVAHVEVLGGIAHGERAIGRIGDFRTVFRHDAPPDVESVQAGRIPLVGSGRSRLSGRDGRPIDAVRGILQGDGRLGRNAAGRPAQHHVGPLHDAAIVVRQRGQPEVGRTSAGLIGSGIRAQIEPISPRQRGFRTGPDPRVAQIDDRRRVGVAKIPGIHAQIVEILAPAAGDGLQVQIAGELVGEPRFERNAVGILSGDGLPVRQFFPFSVPNADPGGIPGQQIVPVGNQLAVRPGNGGIGIVRAAGHEDAVAQLQGESAQLADGRAAGGQNRAIGNRGIRSIDHDSGPAGVGRHHGGIHQDHVGSEQFRLAPPLAQAFDPVAFAGKQQARPGQLQAQEARAVAPHPQGDRSFAGAIGQRQIADHQPIPREHQRFAFEAQIPRIDVVGAHEQHGPFLANRHEAERRDETGTIGMGAAAHFHGLPRQTGVAGPPDDGVVGVRHVV